MRKILRFLDELAGGRVAAELESAIDEVVAAVKARDRKGSVTLRLVMTPDDRSADGIVFQTDVDRKTPRTPIPPGLMYRTATGGLSPFDPRQRQIPGLTAVGEEDNESVESVDDRPRDIEKI